MKHPVEERHIAASQDALVVQAIAELARRVRDADDARPWAAAGLDAQFRAAAAHLAAEFAEDDLGAWESRYLSLRHSTSGAPGAGTPLWS